MASGCELEKLACHYNTEKSIILVKENESIQDVYNITIYFDTNSKNIKITVMNKKNEEESYSCVLVPEVYKLLCEEQDLLVKFEEFPEALKKILAQCKPTEIYIKLTINEDICLGFYTKSQLKELSVLKLPFECTNPHEIIMHFKQQLLKSTNVNETLIKQNNALEAELSQMNNRFAAAIQNLRDLGQRNLNMRARNIAIVEEYKQLGHVVKENEEEKMMLLKKSDICESNSAHVQQALNSVMIDVNSLKTGVTYYMMKAKRLQNTLDKVEKTTVPIVKYRHLMGMFSTAVADLMKNQLYLKKVSSLHELQNSDNKSLKDALAHCIQTIKNMESNLRTAESHMNGFKQKELIQALEKKLETENKL